MAKQTIDPDLDGVPLKVIVAVEEVRAHARLMRNIAILVGVLFIASMGFQVLANWDVTDRADRVVKSSGSLVTTITDQQKTLADQQETIKAFAAVQQKQALFEDTVRRLILCDKDEPCRGRELVVLKGQGIQSLPPTTTTTTLPKGQAGP